MGLRVYNSLSRSKETFTPLTPGFAGMYVCGPTVYGHSHIGHAKSYVAFDVIAKWLRRTYRVRYVQNITDVGHLTDNADEGEDKIGLRAELEQVHPLEIVDMYMRSYYEDMEALGVAHPNMYVRATQHILEQIELTRQLIDRGHAYVSGGNVYFDVSSWPYYGCLSGRRPEDQMESGRIEGRGDKRDPRDFALWKSAEGTGHILRWMSPWSEGYPGWHVECSAMAMRYLGESFDIHGGGIENMFPHHECEIAQSRAGTDGGFARYWLHNNMINVDGRKMGKSLGNSVFIKDALKTSSAATLRLFLLQTHYGRPSNYTPDGLKAAKAGTERLGEAAATLARAGAGSQTPGAGDDGLKDAIARATADITAAMDDDFNTPLALGALFDYTTAVNTHLSSGVSAAAAQAAFLVYKDFASDLLGVLPQAAAGLGGDVFAADLMALVLEVRARLRLEKNWALSDLIRDRFAALKVNVKDEKDGGATWTRE